MGTDDDVVGVFDIVSRPDEMPETVALHERFRSRLAGVLAVGLPADFGQSLALSVALWWFADSHVCLDVEQYCDTLVETAKRLVRFSAGAEEPVVQTLAACGPGMAPMEAVAADLQPEV